MCLCRCCFWNVKTLTTEHFDFSFERQRDRKNLHHCQKSISLYFIGSLCLPDGGVVSASLCSLFSPAWANMNNIVASILKWIFSRHIHCFVKVKNHMKGLTRAFSWLKVAATAFTFKTLLRHYAKRALTPRSLNVKLGPRHKSHKGRAVWLA